MRLKLFRAPRMAEAMAQVRAGLGEDAVILGSRRVAGGVEVTAALDVLDPVLIRPALVRPAVVAGGGGPAPPPPPPPAGGPPPPRPPRPAPPPAPTPPRGA